jgi:hypothetical protein
MEAETGIEPVYRALRIFRLVMIAAVVALAAGCTAQAARPAERSSAAARDPRTAAALLKIATVFNSDYDGGVYGPVWDRWDARSQAVISRADYIRRHTECPDSPQSVTVEDASPGPGGAWIVDYETGGVQLHDYWFYARGRWVFDLMLSNPDSVKLYRLSPQQYIAALGCTP